MKLEELITYCDYDIPSLEFYNEYGQLEYSCNLENFEFEDIDIVFGKWFEPYGVIKLQRKNEETRFNGKGLQSPESKL